MKWNDSWANLGDSRTILKWFLSKSWWFVNHSKMILERILVILIDSWTILKLILESISVICKPFWNDFQAILGDSQTIQKWFFCESWWFLVIGKPFWNEYQMNLCGSQWFMIHSEMILEQILVVLKPFWKVIFDDLQNILKWFSSKSQWFVNHSEIILKWILVICEPFCNDCQVNLGDSRTNLQILRIIIYDYMSMNPWRIYANLMNDHRWP